MNKTIIALAIVLSWSSVVNATPRAFGVRCNHRMDISIELDSAVGKAMRLGAISAGRICYCTKYRWTGVECDLNYLIAMTELETDRKNQLIADQILRDMK